MSIQLIYHAVKNIEKNNELHNRIYNPSTHSLYISSMHNLTPIPNTDPYGSMVNLGTLRHVGSLNFNPSHSTPIINPVTTTD